MKECAKAARQRGDDPNELPRRTRGSSTPRLPAAQGHDGCIHLCRGNFRSAWAAEGGYEPVAECCSTSLQWMAISWNTTMRARGFRGRFATCRKADVVLGLVSTKVGRLESKDDLKRRIDEAARRVPLEQLCLSPQCGFSAPFTATTSPWNRRRRN